MQHVSPTTDDVSLSSDIEGVLMEESVTAESSWGVLGNSGDSSTFPTLGGFTLNNASQSALNFSLSQLASRYAETYYKRRTRPVRFSVELCPDTCNFIQHFCLKTSNLRHNTRPNSNDESIVGRGSKTLMTFASQGVCFQPHQTGVSL